MTLFVAILLVENITKITQVKIFEANCEFPCRLNFSSLYFIIDSHPLYWSINFDQIEHISNVCYEIKQPLV